MKVGKIIKTAIKLALIIYPVVRKMKSEKKESSTTIHKG